MGFAWTRPKGVRINVPTKTSTGFTLFTPYRGKQVFLIDMEGEVVHEWKMPDPPALYAELLPNGNLLYASHKTKGPLVDFTGAGGELLEVDWDGNIVWKYEDPYLHHAFYRMNTGNTLVLSWVRVPEEIAGNVRGGIAGSEQDGVIWADSLQEINPNGKVVWEWLSYKHLEPEVDIICPLCPRSEWLGINACEVCPDGNILTCFMKTNTIAIINKDTGSIKWRWGAGEIGHAHHPTVLANDNILLFDNGRHCTGLSVGYSRVLEVNPKTNQIEWAYLDTPWYHFFSSIMGSCQPLMSPRGNVLICEGATGRIFEVTRESQIVWEYISPFWYDTPKFGRTNMVSRAHRYSPEYEGLK